MENISLNIGERKIPLRFRMNQFIEIEENVGNLGEVKELILKGRNRLRNLVTVIRILGNAGLEEAGQKGDLTDKWVLRHMKPALVVSYAVLVLMEILEGNKIEDTEPGEKKGPVDVGLQEQEAKKQQGN